MNRKFYRYETADSTFYLFTGIDRSIIEEFNTTGTNTHKYIYI